MRPPLACPEAIQEGQLARLFDEGRHPLTGEPLGLPYRHDSKRTVVTGFALSFSPPKSVSLVGAFGDTTVATEVRAAHDAAVAAALGFLEEHAATVGLHGAEVAIAAVEHLQRQDTGKLKRFVPLRPDAVKAA